MKVKIYLSESRKLWVVDIYNDQGKLQQRALSKTKPEVVME